MLFGVLTRSREKTNLLKKLIINAAHPEERRAAIIENGVLQQLSIENTTREQTRGNIYKGVVQKIEYSLHAAFVEYGGSRPGFLPLNEVHPKYYSVTQKDTWKKPPAEKILRKNQEVVVQVAKEGKGTKGASLSTYLSIPGRYLVLMPGEKRTGVSKKIEDETERKKLKDIGKQLKLPDSMGFIIRTAGLNKTKKELQRDANYLLRLLNAIESRSRDLPVPSMIYQETNSVIQAIRDYFTTDISEVLVDDPDLFKRVRDFFKLVIPKNQKIVKPYEERIPIFQKFNIEEQIECLYKRTVPLKSGGSISIDPTEALVSVDVNTAHFTRGKNPEQNTLITNLEAADEIARQLRLRDLGGLIVIDFIDMKSHKDRQLVEKQFKNAFRVDKANTEFARISKFGILEMSREQLRAPLIDMSHENCEYCKGTGKTRSRESLSLAILHEIYDLSATDDLAEIKVTLSREAGEYLLNQKRSELHTIEKHFGGEIHIFCEQRTPVDAYTIKRTGKKK